MNKCGKHSNKALYYSEMGAVAACKRMMLKNNRKYFHYKCPISDGWHITSKQ